MMNNKIITTVSMMEMEDGRVKKEVVEVRDGIRTRKVYIDGVEQKPEQANKEELKKAATHTIVLPNGATVEIPANFTDWTPDEVYAAAKKAQEEKEKAEKSELERQVEIVRKNAERMAAQKKEAERMAEIHAQLEAEKARIKEVTEAKINEEVAKYKKFKAERIKEKGKFAVRFFTPGEDVRIAEKRFMRAEDIYRPQLGECVYLDGWLAEGEEYDKYYDVRFIVTDVTMCLGEDEEDTVLIDIDVEPYDDYDLGYIQTGWDC